MGLVEKWPVIKAWRFFLVFGLPIALLPIPLLGKTSTANAAYVVQLMAVYFMTEAAPISVTALLPVALFPLFNIQDTEILAQQYLKDSVQLFVGGLLVALAFEYSGFHKRIALRVMLFTGTSTAMLLLGIMLTTAFLSMWMFNTATTAMMVPIITSIVEELEKSLNALYIQNIDSNEAKSSNKSHNSKNVSKSSPKISINPRINRRPTPNVVDAQNMCIEFNERYLGVDNIGFIPEENEDIEMNELPGSSQVNIKNINEIIREKIDPAQKFKNQEQLIKVDKKKLESSLSSLKTMLLLSTCYSSNLGGTGVLTGSGTNLVAIEFLGDLNPAHHGNFSSLTFASWMGFNIFPMLINILIAWLYLQLIFIGLPNKYRFWLNATQRSLPHSLFNKEIEDKIKKMLEEKYVGLGKLTTHEIGVLVLFGIVVTSWIFHEPKFIPGWSSWFKNTKVSISTSSLLISVLFFIVPRNEDFYSAIRKRDFTGVKIKPLLDYDFAIKKFPWGVVLLLGGGYAMSNGAKKAGLSSAIGQSLSGLRPLSPSMIQLSCMFLIGFVTEVASNTATASIVIPILLELSQELNIHPLYLTLPATTTCSYAFMLPVATPPNAIVYAAGGIKVSDMIKTGFFMNCACILVLFLTTNLYGEIFFNFSTYSYVP